MPLLRRIIVIAPFLFALASPAYAHTPSPGLKGFWSGVLHLISDPAQMVMLAAVCFWAGQVTLTYFRPILTAAVIACTLGLAIGFTGLSDKCGLLFGLLAAPEPTLINLIMLIAAALTAICAALAPQKGKVLIWPATLVISALAGYANVPDPGAVSALAVTVFGSVTAYIYILVVGSVGLQHIAERYTYAWLPIAMRTASAWTATIAVLLFASQVAIK